jgi:hypothetical protein
VQAAAPRGAGRRFDLPYASWRHAGRRDNVGHFAARIVSDGQIWIDMLDHRNLLSHKYDQTLLSQGLTEIQQRYLPALSSLHDYLQGQAS